MRSLIRNFECPSSSSKINIFRPKFELILEASTDFKAVFRAQKGSPVP